MRKKVIIYTRVSTEEQKKNGFSLQEQRKLLIQFSERQNYEIIGDYEEDYSAKDFNRPQFNALMAALESKKLKADFLLISRPDRFSRNLQETLNMFDRFKKVGIVLRTPERIYDPAQMTDSDYLMFILDYTLPQVDNIKRSMVTAAGMREGLKQGRWMHMAPIGYLNQTVGSRSQIVPDPEMAPLIKEAFELLALGIYNVSELHRKMDDKGLKTCSSNFPRIFKKPVYCGRIVVPATATEPEEIVTGIHEPLISEELFDKVQQILNTKKREHTKRGKYDSLLPLRGLLICPRCGGKLTASPSKNRTGNLYFYYHCQKGCPERIPIKEIHDKFLQLLKTFTFPEELIVLFHEVLKDVWEQNEGSREKQKQGLEKKLRDQQTKLSTVDEAFVSGSIESENYQRITARYKVEINDLKSRIADLSVDDSRFLEFAEYGLSLMTDLPGYYENASLRIKKKLVCSIFPQKLIYENKNYRTPQINKMLEILTIKNNELRGYKAKRAAISDNPFYSGIPKGN